jgi:hypothetical protein
MVVHVSRAGFEHLCGRRAGAALRQPARDQDAAVGQPRRGVAGARRAHVGDDPHVAVRCQDFRGREHAVVIGATSDEDTAVSQLSRRRIAADFAEHAGFLPGSSGLFVRGDERQTDECGRHE